MDFYFIYILQMEQIEIDVTDIKLLDALQTDASMSNQALAELVHISPPTCLRRVKRMKDAGLIEREIALLSLEKLAHITGHGLTAIVEITLDRQGDEHVSAFEKRINLDAAVQQCYRTSPGPDFVLIVHVADMPAYLALSQRLFTSDANVRNVKAFFSIKRSKFEPKVLFNQ
jgi:Lrp/AsnC family transcriptional regulator, leucine-responsive regulatory protein